MKIKLCLGLFVLLGTSQIMPAPIHNAAALGRYFKIKWLLARGTDINERDADGNTALHYTRFSWLAKTLLDHNADVNAQNNDGITPLHVAVVRGRPRMVNKLITAGAHVNLADNNSITPLHLATAISYFKNKSALSNPLDPTATQKGAFAALGATISGALGIIGVGRFLATAKPGTQEVAVVGSLKLVEVTRPPTPPAVLKGATEELAALQVPGQKVLEQEMAQAAQQSSWLAGAKERADALRAASPTTTPVEEVTVTGRFAARKPAFKATVIVGVILGILSAVVAVDVAIRYHILSLLLGAGAKVNAQDNARNTPLHILAGGSLLKPGNRRGGVLMAHQLLSHGASRTIENSEGKTPYAVARRNNRWLLMSLLKPKAKWRKA